MAVFEIEHTVGEAHLHEIGSVPRPANPARCGNLAPLYTQAGWGALASDETINVTESASKKDKSRRSSIGLPKRLRQRGIPMKKLKHLSAIIESPRSRSAKSPPPAVLDNFTAVPQQAIRKVHTMSQLADVEGADDVFTCPDSPKPDILPSFAIRSPGMYGAAIANDEKPKPSRSVSMTSDGR